MFSNIFIIQKIKGGILMKEKILSEINNIKEELIDLSTYIYQNPELGFEEFKSSKAHIDLLKNYGFEVEENYLNYETAFKAVYNSNKPGPTIAFLVEFDALPGIGHGCGHNILGTTSTGAGIVLKNLMDQLGGKIYVLGSPAEETSGVKVDMAESGTFDDVDIAMMAHPDSNNRRSGASLDLYPIEFTFKGKTSHASSAPEEGINALDACIQTFNNINALREHLDQTTRIHGIIKEGGEAANVVPDKAVAQFYIRTPKLGYMDILKEKVINCAKAGALATGCELEMRNYEKPYKAMVTNQTLSDLFNDNFIEAGATNIMESELGGSIDMGDVSQVCPAIHPYFSISNEYVTPHSREFAAKTLEETAFNGMEKTIYALVKTSIDVINNPDILEKIKDEFNSKIK